MTLGENFERVFAEGKRVPPAPAFTFRLPSLAMELGLEKQVVLGVPHA